LAGGGHPSYENGTSTHERQTRRASTSGTRGDSRSWTSTRRNATDYE
jgi:hypothetical protein